jgi:hypothetical protein
MANMIAERSQAILGYTPVLTHATKQPTDNHELLEFKIDKLIASGFASENNFNFELDHLLELSKRFVS